jgi:hypothetical protein
MPLFLCNLIILLQYIQSFTHNIRWGPSPYLHSCRLSGRNLPGVPSRDSNSGLPYSKPPHYQLSCAAPYWAALHPTELRCTDFCFVTFTFFDVFVLCTIRFVTQYVLWRCTLCNGYVLKFLRFVFLLSVQLRLVTYTYVNVYVVGIYVM